MYLYLLHYNNYYNRIVKKEDTVYDYSNYVIGEPLKYDNFHAADGVNTKIIINWNDDIPDYLIVAELNNEIVSRWFVIEAETIRKGQYSLTLRRDVIADNYEEVIKAPCYIEKATLNADDPMIFNHENMEFNQIKQSETLLKDETNTPWIVGYIASDSFPDDTRLVSTFVDAGATDLEIDDIKNWKFYDYTELATDKYPFYMGNANIKYSYVFNIACGPDGREPQWYIGGIDIDKNGNNTVSQGNPNIPGDVKSMTNGTFTMKYATAPSKANIGDYELRIYQGSKTLNKTAITDGGNGYLKVVQDRTAGQMGSLNVNLESQFGIYTDTDPYSAEIKNLNGKTILDKKTNTVYKIEITTDSSYQRYFVDHTPFEEGMNSVFPRSIHHEFLDSTFVGNGGIMEGLNFFQFEGVSYKISLVQQQIHIETTVLGKDVRTHLADAPYDMFCMPYTEGIEIIDNGVSIKNSGYAALNMAITVGSKSGQSYNPDTLEWEDIAGRVYDIQLLPYCPIRKVIQNGKIDITSVKKNAIKNTRTGKIYTYMIWCDYSNFTFDIPVSININDYKISNECDLYRLCSPNYGSAFDFSPAMNRGVDRFNVDATYKPFDPYIHVNPNFKGLYGNDFNDMRGLIVGGDFSITQLSSEWANYVMTNKNYQNAFDRNIQNLEFKNTWAKKQDITNAVFGSATAGLTSAFGVNAMGGGPIASGVAAGVGVLGGAAAGVGDVIINEKLRKEEIRNTQDQFNFAMGSIKAIPYALAKTSALTANNKLYPFLEYYTCSDVEREALMNKIKYNGMTVDRIGTVKEFIKPEPTYIKGRIIRLENIPDDFHMISEIASELNQGIFI